MPFKKKPETIERRKSQCIIQRELKVCTSNKKRILDKLDFLFLQAKWITNHCIASGDIMNYKYNEHKVITSLDKDGNVIDRELSFPSHFHQPLVERIKQNVVNLSKTKNKGYKVGKLKFKSEVNTIPFDIACTKILNGKVIVIPGFAANGGSKKDRDAYNKRRIRNGIRVRGIDNLPPVYELVTARLIRRTTGIYIQLTMYVLKERKEIHQDIGIDFGIKNTITTSTGEIYDCSIGESETLKKRQRRFAKTQKGSNNRAKLKKLVGKEYEHITNKRNDAGNKIYADISHNSFVYYQDDNFNGWKAFNFGRKVHYGVLGRVKQHLQNSEYAFAVGRFEATSKTCSKCGWKNNNLGLGDRVFTCGNCSLVLDRDVNAAVNIKNLGINKRFGTNLDGDKTSTLIANDEQVLLVKSEMSKEKLV